MLKFLVVWQRKLFCAYYCSHHYILNFLHRAKVHLQISFSAIPEVVKDLILLQTCFRSATLKKKNKQKIDK